MSGHIHGDVYMSSHVQICDFVLNVEILYIYLPWGPQHIYKIQINIYKTRLLLMRMIKSVFGTIMLTTIVKCFNTPTMTERCPGISCADPTLNQHL